MALDAVGAADDQHRAVQHPQRPLGLGGKVHVARGIQQGEGYIPPFKYRLLGKNGDASGPFQGKGVQKGVPVVHPPQLPQTARGIKHSLRKSGLARVHMGQQTRTDSSHGLLLFLFTHSKNLLL